MNTLTGKDIRISNIPRLATNAEPVCTHMYAHTAATLAPAQLRS